MKKKRREEKIEKKKSIFIVQWPSRVECLVVWRWNGSWWLSIVNRTLVAPCLQNVSWWSLTFPIDLSFTVVHFQKKTFTADRICGVVGQGLPRQWTMNTENTTQSGNIGWITVNIGRPPHAPTHPERLSWQRRATWLSSSSILVQFTGGKCLQMTALRFLVLGWWAGWCTIGVMCFLCKVGFIMTEGLHELTRVWLWEKERERETMTQDTSRWTFFRTLLHLLVLQLWTL